MMDELLPWLRAVLDEEERLALDAGGSGPAGRWVEGEPLGAAVGTESGEAVVFENSPPTLGQQRHIAEHDPARVLAEVDAKRRILDWCEQQRREVDYPSAEEARPGEAHRAADGHVYAQGGPDVGWVRLREQTTRAEAHKVAQLVALPCSDRPGYRDEWRPE